MVYAEIFAVMMGFSLIVFRPATESYAIKVQRLRQQHIVNRLEAMALKHADDAHFEKHEDEDHVRMLKEHVKKRKVGKNNICNNFRNSRTPNRNLYI
jgi:hypothetical protein